MVNTNIDLCFKRQFILSAMPWMFSPPGDYNAFRIQQLNQLNESNIEHYVNLCSSGKYVEFALTRDKPFIGTIIELIDKFKSTQQNKHELLQFTRAYRSLLAQPLTTLTIALMNLYNIMFEFLYDNFDNVKLELNDLTTDSDDDDGFLLVNIGDNILPPDANDYHIDIDDNGNYTLFTHRK